MAQRMKFSLEVANRLIDKEELDSVEALLDLMPKRCEKFVDRIANPGRLDATDNPNCHGIYVPKHATTRLPLASQLAKMWDRTQRPYTLAHIESGVGLAKARRQMELEEKHTNDFVTIQPLTNKDLDDRNFFDLAEEIHEGLAEEPAA